MTTSKFAAWPLAGIVLGCTEPSAVVSSIPENSHDVDLAEDARARTDNHEDAGFAPEASLPVIPDAEAVRCRTASAGALLWTQSYLDPTSTNFSGMYQLLPTPEGLLAAGTMATQDGSAGWLAKLGISHEVVWQELVPSADADCRATALRDGGIFAGCTVSVNCPPGSDWHDCDNDVVFRRYAPDESVAWEDRFSTEPNKGNDGTGGGFVEASNGDIIVPYNFSTPGSSSDASRAHLRRYAADGALAWDTEVVLPVSGNTVNLSQLVGTADGDGLFAAASAGENTAVARFDGKGVLAWSVSQTGSRSLYDIALAGDRVVAVGAEGSGMERAGVVEVFSTDGQSLLVKYFAGIRAYVNAVTATTDGRIFIALISEDGPDETASASVIELSALGDEVWRSSGFGDSLNIVSGLSLSDDCTLLIAGRRWQDVGGSVIDVAFGGELSL